MKTPNSVIEILNDLVMIHNDRITGYERALAELKHEDDDLKPLFTEYIDQSRRLKNELGNEVQTYGGSIESGTTTGGKIYRAWMDVKAIFTGHDRHTVLSNCEFGEDAAQKAYTDALKEEVPAYIAEMLLDQKDELKEAHDEIKSYRDQYV
ncbi:MAG TPA: PA2169 family four-helix-bundle protein [Panacibacter sp.]|nr:PA2169 family four-helix-bundle protein [Panacibacter sp.]